MKIINTFYVLLEIILLQLYSNIILLIYFSGDHTYEPVCIAISLASNVKNNITGKVPENALLNKLSSLKDNVQEFNEISCASG